MKWSELISQEALNVGLGLRAKAQQEHDEGRLVCPPPMNIFRALELTPPEKTKVVIVGQDPYHTPGVANGLAFSIMPDVATLPPSLRNIFRELAVDLGVPQPQCGDLTAWAAHGALLINSSLSVYEHQANSHSNWGWQKFTSELVAAAANLPQPIVFLLWGANAQDLQKYIITGLSVCREPGIILQPKTGKDIIMSSHPSPFSASKGCRDTPAFLGSKPFSNTNRLLIARGAEPMDWSL
ncbi:MAG: uracil-DNA glycosylase [Acetobacter sp.]|nr:uracil-DNA glycosylase [Acetobacter sp.]